MFLLSMFFFFKLKTAYEMRISDWSSDVCSSDLQFTDRLTHRLETRGTRFHGVARTPGPPVVEQLFITREISRFLAGLHPVGKLRGRRSEERRVGKECVSTCRFRWSPYQ